MSLGKAEQKEELLVPHKNNKREVFDIKFINNSNF